MAAGVTLTFAETTALQDLAQFPLVEALLGRRSRRFALGDEIPDGPLAYRSQHEPMPLSDGERLIVLSAMGGTTGWHYAITRNARYAPHLANYAAAVRVTPAEWRCSAWPPSRCCWPVIRAPAAAAAGWWSRRTGTGCPTGSVPMPAPPTLPRPRRTPS